MPYKDKLVLPVKPVLLFTVLTFNCQVFSMKIEKHASNNSANLHSVSNSFIYQ
jgi:hypothetical protein